MIAVLQRVSEASVKVDHQLIAQIGYGFLVLLGIAEDDDENDLQYLVRKIVSLRAFSDDTRKMNLSIQDIEGEILLVSQFTLIADTNKGNRPSFGKAAKPDKARKLYELFGTTMQSYIKSEIKTGVFGADMKVSLCNDGPVTLILNSKNLH